MDISVCLCMKYRSYILVQELNMFTWVTNSTFIIRDRLEILLAIKGYLQKSVSASEEKIELSSYYVDLLY